MKKYKILSLLLALIFSVSILVACGPQGTVGSNTNSTHTHSVPSSGVSSTSSDTNTESSDTDTETDSESSDTETENKAAENALPKEYWVEEPGKKFGQDVVLIWMQPSEKIYWDYTVADFPETEVAAMSNQGGGETVCIALILKTPSKENVISTIRALEKRSDVYKATPEYDKEKTPYEFKEDTRFTEDCLWANIQPSSRHHTYTVEDFPELECVSVEERRIGKFKDVCITLKYPSKENVVAAVKLLEKRSDLYSVEPNEVVNGIDAAIDGRADLSPNDAAFVAGTQWGLTKIQAPYAWDIATGRDTITVGVIDSGIAANHPDLQGRINGSLSKCFVGTGNSALEDLHGHGTHVAGIIGAQENNSSQEDEEGMAGVCWDVSLVSLRISIENNEDGEPDLVPNAAKNAILYATQQGIDIINMSSGGYDYDAEWEEAIRNYPGLFVCSAGNEGTDLDGGYRYPGSYQFRTGISNIIVVGASTSNDGRWLYYDENNEQKGSNHGTTHVDLFAPGAGIYSCVPSGSYQSWSGTSMAAPHVAGVAALILSTNPNMSTQQLKAYVLNNADSVSALSSYCKTGKRLNAYRAVSAAHPDHYYDTIDNVNHIAYCTCGAYIWIHNYTFHYQAVNALNHYAYCSCGAYKTQAHTYVASGANRICTKCNYLYLINKTDPELETE